jgi:hypothetical protein
MSVVGQSDGIAELRQGSGPPTRAGLPRWLRIVRWLCQWFPCGAGLRSHTSGGTDKPGCSVDRLPACRVPGGAEAWEADPLTFSLRGASAQTTAIVSAIPDCTAMAAYWTFWPAVDQ